MENPGNNPNPGPHRAPIIGETLLLAVAGLAVLATARTKWISEGVGSTLNGQELADSLRNGALVPDGGVWVAAAMYLLVALGGLLLASSGFAGLVVASTRLAAGLAVALPLGVAAIAGWFPLDRWAIGPIIVVLASVVAVVASVRQLVWPRRD